MTTSETLSDRQTTEVEAALADLEQGEQTWAGTGLARRRRLLDEVGRATAEHADEWVQVAAMIKGLPAGSPLLGEEWTSGPYPLLTSTTALAASLRALELGANPVDGYQIGSAPGGRVAVSVLPHTVFDRLLLHGFSAQVWMPPGVDRQTVRAQAGLGQREPSRTQGIGAVMGAGNITSIPVLDVLYELYAHNRVVALKLNPITDPLLPVFEKVLAPLIELGLLRILTGGADVGSHLVHHDRVAHVHMTGSAGTHDAIVFGTGEQGAQRKRDKTPLLDKDITSELGGVSPTIVVPGSWTDADLRYQAEHVITQRLHNGGYNCIASQVVVVSSDWPQRDRFLSELRDAMNRVPRRVDYYPGSADRVSAALGTYPDAEQLDGRVLIPGVSPDQRAALLSTEYFAPVLGVIELPGTGLDFLHTAVRTANEEFTGTLGVNVLAHPQTLDELGPSFDDALVELRYGTIAVNAWTGLGYLTATAGWGAFPGHTLDDVGSGIGVVHNALLLDGPERTVVRGPFRPAPRSLLHGELAISPKPPWFVTNRTAATTGRLLTRFAADPGWGKLPGIFASALLG